MRSKIRSATAGASPIDGSSSSRSRGAEAMPRPIASMGHPAIADRQVCDLQHHPRQTPHVYASAYHAGLRLHQLFASFETRTRFSPGALLRMRDGSDGIKKEPHPEEPRSGISKDARL